MLKNGAKSGRFSHVFEAYQIWSMLKIQKIQAFICRYDKNENLLENLQFSISFPGIFPTASGKNGLCVSASKITIL